MKRQLLLFVIFCFSFFIAKSQHLDFQFGGGLGESYMVEQTTAGYNINFHHTSTMFGALRFTPDSSYFNLKLHFQYVNSRISHEYGSGNVSSLTSFIIAEHLKTDKQFNLGYDIGGGYTVEDFYFIDYLRVDTEVRRFISFRIGLLASMRAGKKGRLSMEPSLFWTDIANSFNEPNWKTAGEDLSFLMNFSYSYRLF